MQRLTTVLVYTSLGVAFACKGPSLAEGISSYDLTIQETDTITPVPTREHPQTIEGRIPQRFYNVYHLLVPPGARLKAELKNSPKEFRILFLSNTLGRNPDPGLEVNRIMRRPDAAFYENATGGSKTIYCIVKAIEPMEGKPYSVTFTDF